MKTWSIAVVAGTVLGASLCAHAQIPFDPRPISWRSDIGEARGLAGRVGKPLLVIFR